MVAYMATRCLTRPQVRAFGFAVEGAQLTRPLRPPRTCNLRCSSTSPFYSPSKVRNPLVCPRITATHQKDTFKTGPPKESPAIESQLSELLRRTDTLSRSTTLPSEESIKEALQSCESLAEILAGLEIESKTDTQSPTSSLLDLEGRRKHSPSSTSSLTRSTRDRIAEEVSRAAYRIVTTPQVFITPPLLATYVDTQALLNRPETIPPIFVLYASKPLPRPGTATVEYTKSNPNKASSSIPTTTANNALDAAIDAKNLPVCFDIINTTVCTPAFVRNKLVRKALFPLLGAAIAPVAAYSAASQWAVWQDTMDNQMARNVMFAGLLAYLTFTATIGVVAVTTSNDQMDRVTWASGTPLRERWLREEERAMVDKIAGAWGFQESWRRGEEEGPDWQKLREWAGLRGMVLDKVALMEGME